MTNIQLIAIKMFRLPTDALECVPGGYWLEIGHQDRYKNRDEDHGKRVLCANTTDYVQKSWYCRRGRGVVVVVMVMMGETARRAYGEIKQ